MPDLNTDNSSLNGGVRISTSRGLLAVSPIVIFLLIYLVVSICIGDFYKMPIIVALLIASAWAVIIMRGEPLLRRIETFSAEAGSSNVMYMIWIFILAGAFAALAKMTGSAEATVSIALRYMPDQLIVPGLFLSACLISLAVGTSVGTVVALTPLVVEMTGSDPVSTPFLVAVVLGGAFFGDNLSFISDTTIAATRTQGCDMRDKFRANILIVVPAAVITLLLYIVIGFDGLHLAAPSDASPWMVLPYLVVIVCAISGINVMAVLTLGIITSLIQGLLLGYSLLDLFGFMGDGMESMGQLTLITLMAAGMLGLIKALGGIKYIIQTLTLRIRGSRGAQASIAALVSIVNLCTANNTVAIITVGELAKNISAHYGISPRKSASLLDTCSCITQALIPYGAQTLMAVGIAHLTPTSPWPYLYYPWVLIVCTIISICVKRRK